jgi:poly(A) polymerase
MKIMTSEYISNSLSEVEAAKLAGDVIISKQISSTSIPRHFTHMARDIWSLQVRLKRTKKRVLRVLMHPRFRAAYDFLLLRTQSGESLDDLVEYWTKEQLNESIVGKGKIKKPEHSKNRSYQRSRNSRKKDL